MNEREIDQELVERAQAGDKKAFERLVEKYQRKLGGFCRALFATMLRLKMSRKRLS